MGLLDAIVGFAGGAGQALADTEMTNFKSLVEQDRQAALLKMQSQFRQDEHKANALVTEGIRREGRDSDFQQDMAQAPQRADMAAEAAKKMDLAKFSDEVVKARESALNMARAGELGFKLDNLESIKAVDRAKAQAEHIESSGSLAQADLARFQLGQAQKLASAQDALAQAESSGDADKILAARKQLSALNSKGEDARDAATLMRTAENIRRQAKDENEPSRKADLEKKAEQFESLALSQMNMEQNKTLPAPSAAAINDLKAGKGSAEQFDAVFGKGAAEKAMKDSKSVDPAVAKRAVVDQAGSAIASPASPPAKSEKSKADRIAEIESALRADDNSVSIIGALTGDSIVAQRKSGKSFSGKLSLGERNSLEAELKTLKAK